MRFFDAHCDTVIPVLEGGQDFLQGSQANIDLPRLQAVGARVQVFAVFTAARHYPEEGDLVEYAWRATAEIRRWAAASGGALRLALTAADTAAAFNPGQPVYGILALEGADPLVDRADNLQSFFNAGVRHVIPAWDDNAFAGTCTGSGEPFTAEGLRLVELCEALGVMVDVSHLSDAGFWQLCDVARRPFVASHSDCRALCPASRNLTDDMIRALVSRGGVMGINLASYFLDPAFKVIWDEITNPYVALFAETKDRAARDRLKAERRACIAAIPRPDPAWIVRHIQHAIQVGGEDCIGLGGDLDGVEVLPDGINGVESYPALADALLGAGLTEAQVEKVCWRNMARVYAEVLPG